MAQTSPTGEDSVDSEEPVFADTMRLIAHLPFNSRRHSSTHSLSRDPYPHRYLSTTYHTTIFAVKNQDCVDECVRLYWDRLLYHLRDTAGLLGLLNMASDQRPGGGVLRGMRAQEEDVCRRTSLYPSLIPHKYPLGPDELIVSRDVVVVKDRMYRPLAPRARVEINVVLSMAALREPKLLNRRYESDADRDSMRTKIRVLLEHARDYNVKYLVLGAFGCGSYGNPADEVADLFQQLLTTEFVNVFKYVVFAILEPFGRTPSNDAFRRAFSIGTAR